MAELGKDERSLRTDDFLGDDPEDRRTFLERLGVQRDGDSRLILKVGPGHLRGLGITHGGVIATLLDSVMGMVAAQSARKDHYLVTAQINVHFLRPAREGETLVASSEVRHQGQKTAVTQGELRTESNALIATATATFIHVRHTDQTRPRTDS